MNYHTQLPGLFGGPIKESHAQAVCDGIDTLIRLHGKTHRELAELAQVDPATFTLFAQRKLPGDWQQIACKVDEVLVRLSDELYRESQMPVRTPMIMGTLKMVRLLIEDGGIGLIQGDSGTGKTEAVRAVALQYPGSILVRASTARARMKPMLEDIGSRMYLGYCSRDTAETYRQVRDRLAGRKLLIVDEVHKYIGHADCLHTLADLLKETNVPQLWTATGDLRRYLDLRTGGWRDPFAQIRSRISHTIDLAEAGSGVIRPEDMRELAKRKFNLKLDAAAARELCEVARLDNEGSLRLVENTLKHAKRLAAAGKVEMIDARLVRACMDRSLSKRTRERARKIIATETPATPAEAPQQRREALRATA